MPKRSKYVAKIAFQHGVNNKFYNVGDEVDLPDKYLYEMINNGMIVETFVEEKAVVKPQETATKDPTKEKKPVKKTVKKKKAEK
jgi:hypothetical protein